MHIIFEYFSIVLGGKKWKKNYIEIVGKNTILIYIQY
jgi:hypothetical protein